MACEGVCRRGRGAKYALRQEPGPAGRHCRRGVAIQAWCVKVAGLCCRTTCTQPNKSIGRLVAVRMVCVPAPARVRPPWPGLVCVGPGCTQLPRPLPPLPRRAALPPWRPPPPARLQPRCSSRLGNAAAAAAAGWGRAAAIMPHQPLLQGHTAHVTCACQPASGASPHMPPMPQASAVVSRTQESLFGGRASRQPI